MKTLKEHNEKVKKEAQNRIIEKELEKAGVLCDECNEELFLTGHVPFVIGQYAKKGEHETTFVCCKNTKCKIFLKNQMVYLK